jgi:hypothetical protein
MATGSGQGRRAHLLAHAQAIVTRRCRVNAKAARQASALVPFGLRSPRRLERSMARVPFGEKRLQPIVGEGGQAPRCCRGARPRPKRTKVRTTTPSTASQSCDDQEPLLRCLPLRIPDVANHATRSSDRGRPTVAAPLRIVMASRDRSITDQVRSYAGLSPNARIVPGFPYPLPRAAAARVTRELASNSIDLAPSS